MLRAILAIAVIGLSLVPTNAGINELRQRQACGLYQLNTPGNAFALTPNAYPGAGDFQAASAVPNQAISPGCSQSATFIQEDGTNDLHYGLIVGTIGGANTYTATVFVKPGRGVRYYAFYMSLGGTPAYAGMDVDPYTCTIFTPPNDDGVDMTAISGTTQKYPNGWCLAKLVFSTATSDLVLIYFQLMSQKNGDPGSYTYQGDGVSGLFFWGPWMRVGTW